MMNYKHTVEAAIANLGEIEDLLKSFREQDSVPTIEIDLAMQKARNLYEILLLLRQTKESKKVSSPESDVPFQKTEPSSGHSSKSNKTSMARQKPEEVKGEKTSVRIAEDNTPEFKRKSLDELQESLSGQTLLHESFHQDIKYQDLSSKIQGKPITDLFSAIGINERFLYIRELFNNDAKKYDKTLEVINGASHFDDAYNFMIREFTWDMDSEIVQSLLDLVRRKFIPGNHE